MTAALLPLGLREFQQLVARDDYWRGRWIYLRHIARLVRALAPETVLEIGPGPHRFVAGSATLDVDADVRPTYLQDAGTAPWPIASGSFALVLGLQCWEHFGGAQLAAFQEAQRIAGPSGHVLISVPYLWRDTNATHRGIGRSTISEWTGGAKPLRTIRVKQPASRHRLILLYPGT